MNGVRQINDKISVAMGQPTPDDLQQAAQAGYKSVLNLRSPQEEGVLNKEFFKHYVSEQAKANVLDVRGDGEYQQGFVPGAKHIFVAHLEEHLERLDRNQTIATYCGSGYRASRLTIQWLS